MTSKVWRRCITIAVLVMSALPVGRGAQASFPGGNGRISFIRHAGLYTHIWSMEPDGSSQTELTFGSVNDLAPTWSPDGSRILFVRLTNDGQALYVMNADGTRQRQMTPLQVQAYAGSWSPGGTLLVFAGSGGACLDIMKVSGGHRVLLCDGFSVSPAWSPAGDLIVLSYVPPSGPFNQLWTIRPDGSRLTQLTFGGAPDGSPDWAPDAAHIVFDRSGYPTSDIYVIDADGGNLVDLTLGAPTDVNSSPAYSPDGTLIAFTGSHSGVYGSDVYVMDADGSNYIQLTTDGLSASPNWQPVPSRWSR